MTVQTFNCAPAPVCDCGLWEVWPNEVQPLVLDWTRYVASTGGYNLASIKKAEIVNLMVSPPAPANPDDIALVSGLATDPATSWPGFTNIGGDAQMPTTLNHIKTGPDIPVGSVYRLDMSVGLVDCHGHEITKNTCVTISVRRSY